MKGLPPSVLRSSILESQLGAAGRLLGATYQSRCCVSMHAAVQVDWVAALLGCCQPPLPPLVLSTLSPDDQLCTPC